MKTRQLGRSGLTVSALGAIAVKGVPLSEGLPSMEDR